jgi:hypothetical protein
MAPAACQKVKLLTNDDTSNNNLSITTHVVIQLFTSCSSSSVAFHTYMLGGGGALRNTRTVSQCQTLAVHSILWCQLLHTPKKKGGDILLFLVTVSWYITKNNSVVLHTWFDYSLCCTTLSHVCTKPFLFNNMDVNEHSILLGICKRDVTRENVPFTIFIISIIIII